MARYEPKPLQRTSPEGREAIADREGEKLEAYLDSGGVWTIGVGHTRNVKEGDTITQEQSDRFLEDDLHTAENALRLFVNVPLNQHMFDALASLVFNIGVEAFRTSTLLKMLNLGLYKDAADQFLRWNKDNGVVVKGLTRRRESERKQFLEPA